MMRVVIVSGKGGTGKTVVSAALASRAAATHRVVLVDADVDAPNLALLLDPVPIETRNYTGMKVVAIDEQRCIACGDCVSRCRFGAIRTDEGGRIRIDPIACEGCGACLDVCPVEAPSWIHGPGGTWWRSDTALGSFVHAELEPGEEGSGRLIATLRREADAQAEAEEADLVLIDGPPGVACPVIAACSGTDLAVVVSEPSPQGLADVERILGLLEHFSIPALLCVNRADVSPERANDLVEVARRHGLASPVMIPYDPAVLRAVRAGRIVTSTDSCAASVALDRLWEKVDAAVAGIRVGAAT